MHAHAKELGLLLVVSKVQALAKRSLASLVQIVLVLQLLVQVQKVLKFLAQAQQFPLPLVQAQ